MNGWLNTQNWESGWWGDCHNTYGEETKQLLYVHRLGLRTFHDGKSPYNFDVRGASVLDIGGGPVSLLLKCHNVRGKVVDPCNYPAWTRERYRLAGMEFEQIAGEDIAESGWDECWLYNVLQHVREPARVVANARRAAKIVRLFEWIDTGTSDGHPNNLTEAALNEWLGGEGKVEQLTGQNTCVGKCYYGVFKGDAYGV